MIWEADRFFDTNCRCSHFRPRLGNLDATLQGESKLICVTELLLINCGNCRTHESMDFDVSHDSIPGVAGSPTTFFFIGTMVLVGNCSPQHGPHSDGRSALSLVSRGGAPFD
jgi:hypothetical protein